MYLIFDVETTGLPRDYNAPIERLDNWPRVVQLAWIFYNEKKEWEEKRGVIIKPEGFVIPKEASDIHGITQERAMAEGSPLRYILEDINVFLKKSKVLVAHNIKFDIKHLGAEFLRKQIETNMFDLKPICTMLKSTQYVGIQNEYGSKWPRLSELHDKLFGKDFEGAHDAQADVLACANCFFEMIKRGLVSEE